MSVASSGSARASSREGEGTGEGAGAGVGPLDELLGAASSAPLGESFGRSRRLFGGDAGLALKPTESTGVVSRRRARSLARRTLARTVASASEARVSRLATCGESTGKRAAAAAAVYAFAFACAFAALEGAALVSSASSDSNSTWKKSAAVVFSRRFSGTGDGFAAASVASVALVAFPVAFPDLRRRRSSFKGNQYVLTCVPEEEEKYKKERARGESLSA